MIDDEADAIDEDREFLLERDEPAEPIAPPAVGDEFPFVAKDGTVLATSRVTAVDDATGEITAVPVWIAPEHVWHEHESPKDASPRCGHHARIPHLVRCDLTAGHDGDHAGATGTRHGWTHRADLPSALEVEQ